MNEHGLTNKVMKKMRELDGVLAYKLAGGRYQASGIPDIMILFYGIRDTPTPCGRTLFVELKSPEIKNPQPTKLQAATMKRMRERGQDVILANSLEQVIAKMEDMGYGCNL